jgi:hypothetical protein
LFKVQSKDPKRQTGEKKKKKKKAVVPNLFWVAEHFGHIRTSCGTLKSLQTKLNVAEQ